MKLRNLNKDYPNYQMEVLEILYGKGSVIGKLDTNSYTAEQADLLIENKAQGFINRRLKTVIDRTPQYVLPFAQTEIQNINGFWGNTLDKADGDIFRRNLGISSNANIISKSWEGDAIKRYKQYLEAFVDDGCILDEDQPEPEQAEMTYREVFNSLNDLSHNIVIEYRHYTRSNANDKWGDYEIISVAGCSSLKLFQNKIASCITDGITNLTKKLKERGTDKKQLIEDVKQFAYRYKNLIADELFTDAKFSGNIGWQIAFEKNRQDAIQNKIPDFIKTWDTGISELTQRLLIVDIGLQNEKFTLGTERPKSSFHYISKDKEGDISTMYESLKKNQFIHDRTTKSIFRTVFIGKPVTNKVVWTGRINTLSHFIKQLVQKEKIEKNADYWQIAQTCFSIDGNSIIPKQLKQAKKPGKKIAMKIDRLIGSL